MRRVIFQAALLTLQKYPDLLIFPSHKLLYTAGKCLRISLAQIPAGLNHHIIIIHMKLPFPQAQQRNGIPPYNQFPQLIVTLLYQIQPAVLRNKCQHHLKDLITIPILSELPDIVLQLFHCIRRCILQRILDHRLNGQRHQLQAVKIEFHAFPDFRICQIRLFRLSQDQGSLALEGPGYPHAVKYGQAAPHGIKRYLVTLCHTGK